MEAAWRVPPPEQAIARIATSLGVQPHEMGTYLTVELPDFPWAWAYQRWHIETVHEVRDGDPPIIPMVVARESFRGASSAQQAGLYRGVLRYLLEEGRPPPLWARCWGDIPEGAEHRQ